MKPQTIKVKPQVFLKRLMRRLFHEPTVTGLLTPAKFKKLTSPPEVLAFERYMQHRCAFKWYVNQRAARPLFNNYLNFHRTKKHPILTTPLLNLQRIICRAIMSFQYPKFVKMNATLTPFIMQNEPNFKIAQIAVTPSILRTKDYRLRTG